MIVAIATLLTALFLGGPAQIFYVDNIEKGIKKHVVEKDRKKEILSEIKSTKAFYKDFEKERKKDYKTFLALYADMNTSIEGFHSFFEELQGKRTDYQNKLIDQRLIILGKIEPEEWDNILKSSVSVADKNIAKAEKKAAKSKESFRKTKSRIHSNILNNEQKQNLLKSLEKIINSEKELISQILSANSSQNKILANKNSGKEELQSLLAEDTMRRDGLVESLLSFHGLARENCSAAEWSKIMKSFTKEMQTSSR
mgnify:CR=1 FL=1